MASISDITFDTMEGRPAEAGSTPEVKERVGEDGSEARNLGQREVDSELTTTSTALDATAAQTAIEAQKDLQGEILEVIDAHGITHASVLILNVAAEMQAVLNPTSNPTHTRMITTRWTVRKRFEA
ncbi:MAG: hypothetical protein KAV00_10520 [Phycisphaerae bacterium]|nr:hypothetical protein [Phycisphaerae bacterium]